MRANNLPMGAIDNTNRMTIQGTRFSIVIPRLKSVILNTRSQNNNHWLDKVHHLHFNFPFVQIALYPNCTHAPNFKLKTYNLVVENLQSNDVLFPTFC